MGNKKLKLFSPHIDFHFEDFFRVFVSNLNENVRNDGHEVYTEV